MEKSITPSLNECIKESFSLPELDLRGYSPLTLAYIGDCVYDMIMKTIIVHKGNKPAGKMHQENSKYVNAKAQSEIMGIIQDQLTQEEHDVYKRGRNTRSVSTAKNQSVTDYRRATGFEALVGYLYLKGDYKRLIELVQIGLEGLNSK